MSANQLPILIAGGGIGGLSAAIALAREGFNVRVLERESAIDVQGAGIQLGPNGVRILQGWGLDGLSELGHIPSLRLMDAPSRKMLAHLRLDKLTQRFGAPYHVIARPDLRELLLRAAMKLKIEIIRAAKVETIEHSPHGVLVRTNRGVEEGEALIGADGIGSTVRRWLCPEANLVFSGKNSWRAICNWQAAPEIMRERDVCVWLAPDAHVVHYPVDGGRKLNVVAIIGGAQAPEGWGAPADARTLVEPMGGWPQDITRFLASLEWKTWPLMTLGGLSGWSRGPVTLLGDAAHPLLPFLASGGVMAIEDAAVLAAEAAKSPTDLTAAFARYEAVRRPRVERVMKASQRMGEIYHMRGAMRFARNAVMSTTPSSLLLARNDWLYGFRV